MSKLNVLPPWLEQKKRNRLLMILIATAQVAIFLLSGVLMFVFAFWETRVWDRVNVLYASVSAFENDARPAEIAAELAIVRAEAAQMAEFHRVHFPEIFESRWFDAVMESVPEGAAVVRMDYRNGEIIVIGEVSDIYSVEVHRAGILETGLFERAGLGRITAMQNGIFNYELRLRVKLLSLPLY